MPQAAIWLRVSESMMLQSLQDRVTLYLREMGLFFEVPSLRLVLIRFREGSRDQLDSTLDSVALPGPITFEAVKVEATKGIDRAVILRCQSVAPMIELQRSLAVAAQGRGLVVLDPWHPDRWRPWIDLARHVEPVEVNLPRFRFDPFEMVAYAVHGKVEGMVGEIGPSVQYPHIFGSSPGPEMGESQNVAT